MSEGSQFGLVPDYLSLKAIDIGTYELLHYAPFDKFITVGGGGIRCLNIIFKDSKHESHALDILE